MHFDNTQFSEREQDVIKLLLQGKGNKQIALALGIASRTVEFHLSNIYAKLGINTRAEAILKLTESHLRDSTGRFHVNSTVAHHSDLTDNGFKSIERRSPVKKISYILGGLLATIFIVLAVIKLFTSNANPIAEATVPEPATATTITATAVVTISNPTKTIPTPTQITSIVIPPHTVNGYTATIESYYADASHIIFQIHIIGAGKPFEDYLITSFNLYNENGGMLNASFSGGPAIDPELYQVEFVPATLLTQDHIKGQLVFELVNPNDMNQIFAKFNFDFGIPLYPEIRFYPKQLASANGLDMLLDSITITPTFTQAYLCFPSPSFADWQIGRQTVLNMGGQETTPFSFRVLFDASLIGDMRAGSEPYWIPPSKNGRCIKSIFPVGSNSPSTITLTIPQLEKTDPEILVSNQFAKDYPGLTFKEAYYKYLEEHGDISKGPWIFTVNLAP